MHRIPLSLLTLAMIIHTIPISLTVGNLLGNAALSIFSQPPLFSTMFQRDLHYLLHSSLKVKGFGDFSFISSSSLFSFSIFIWFGQYWALPDKAQGILMGISIGLIATASISEFILHQLQKVSFKAFLCISF